MTPSGIESATFRLVAQYLKSEPGITLFWELFFMVWQLQSLFFTEWYHFNFQFIIISEFWHLSLPFFRTSLSCWIPLTTVQLYQYRTPHVYKINRYISNLILAGILKRLNHYQRIHLWIWFAGINKVYNNRLNRVLRFIYLTWKLSKLLSVYWTFCSVCFCFCYSCKCVLAV